MKTLITALAVTVVLGFAVLAYAHSTGGWQGNHMMGPGYGNHMMSQDYGNHMMGPGYGGHMGWTGKENEKFLNETVDLRRELHNKRFEYYEAQRSPDTTRETITTLEKEIVELQEKLLKSTPKTASRSIGGYGPCF